MSFKRYLELEAARNVALEFLAKTKDLYKKQLLAGSIRRKEPTVHDIDFAVIPSMKNFPIWRDKMSRRLVEIGGQVISFGEVISNFRYGGIQINLFLCMNDNAWGVTQMWATGPKGHTIGMTIKARSKGLLINSKGLWTLDQPPRLISTRTEEEVGRALGWDFRPPEARGKGGKANSAPWI